MLHPKKTLLVLLIMTLFLLGGGWLLGRLLDASPIGVPRSEGSGGSDASTALFESSMSPDRRTSSLDSGIRGPRSIELPSVVFESESATPEFDPSDEVPRDRIRGRVVDSDGVALPGVPLRASHSPLESLPVTLRPWPETWGHPHRLTVSSAVTDDSGLFELNVIAGEPHVLEVWPDETLARVRKAGAVGGDFLEFQLEPSASLVLRVLDPRTGEKARGVFASIRRPIRDRTLLAPGQRGLVLRLIEVLGEERISGLPPGEVLVEADAVGLAASLGSTLVLEAGETAVLELTLGMGDVLRGRVSNSETGARIDRFWVRVGMDDLEFEPPQEDPHGEVPPRGEFIEVGVHPDVETVEVQARGYASRSVRIREARGAPIFDFVDVALEPERVLRGRVLDESGTPLRAIVGIAGSERRDDGNSPDPYHHRFTSVDGTFEFRSLDRRVHYALQVALDGYGTRVFDVPRVPVEQAEIELPDIVLTRGFEVSGVVVDEAGAPVPHQPILLLGTNLDRDRLGGQAPPKTSRVDLYVGERLAACDSRGRFTVPDVAPGSYRVLSHRDGSSHRATVEVQVVDRSIGGLRIVLPRGLSLEGRIVVPDGGAVPKTYVSVDPERSGDPPADVEVDLDGMFRVHGLGEGTYTLTAYPYPTPEDRKSGRHFARERLTGVAPGHGSGGAPVTLRLRPRLSIEGRVVDAAGQPRGGVRVEAREVGTGVVLLAASTGPDGAFILDLGDGDVVDLLGTLPAEGEDVEAEAPGPRELAHGVSAGSHGLVLTLEGP